MVEDSNKDVMALKNLVEKHKSAAEEAQSRITTLEAEVETLKTESQSRSNDSQALEQTRKDLVAKSAELDEARTAFEGEKKQWADERHQAELNEAASRYSLSPEEVEGLTDVRDIEIVGLKKERDKLSEEAKASAASKQVLDTGHSGGGAGTPESREERARRTLREKGFIED